MTPVIFSTDPGIDDAVAIAIALADPTLDVQLIVPLSGNVDVHLATDNVRKLLTFLHHEDVRVVPGSAAPLLRPLMNAKNIHGASGMDGYDFPAPTVKADTSTTGVEAMHAIIAASSDPITIVAIGPLTDVAVLLQQHPEDKDRIARIMIMGGSLSRGNIGVLSEFNFAVDPEAAKMVFNSGLELHIAPLDVGNAATILPAMSEHIRTLGPVGDMFYHLFRAFRGGSFEQGLQIYDPLAVGMLLQPDLFTQAHTHVAIATGDPLTAGASLIDLEGYLHREANAYVAVDVDVEGFRRWFVDAIKLSD
ncbi:nucleoside hydrolase [Lacticaseibacillus thailandensis]|uniref:Cytidine uridine-specific hydrolase n=1 Tax=Lacticaseibacillus thailandensis DSM 22698 = JCM 13996 TaxID=1423810 RepID=A0A0R2CFA9_9LACO|nr:nucleoside hydrolase [Lacticaseibacillus thailandensis]KRM87113.1 cytidine uridine-specific hydrolase [Lacticaseibacillus thailandensis DSM 22698 = JCM 13996]